MRAMTHIFRASGGRCRKLRLDLAGGDEFVHGSVLHGLLGREDEVAVGVLRHLLTRLPGVPGDDLVHQLAFANDLLGLDLDVDGLALGAAVGLVQEDPRVRERVALGPSRGPATARPRSTPPAPSRWSTRRA